MRKKLGKVVATALSLSLVMASLVGCGDDKGNSGNNDKTTTSSSENTGSDNSENGESTYAETLVLDVFDDQANYQGTQTGWYAKYIKDKFNIELNIIAPNVAGGGDTLYQTRTANGDLGDIIITKLDQSRLKDLVAAGLVLDISEYIDDCPNLQRYMGAIESANKLAEKDGIYAIPSEVSTLKATDPCDATEPTVAPSIRWDVYGDIGYPAIKNLDDFLDVLEKMQTSAREKDGNNNIYAISMFKDWDGDVIQNADGIKGLYGYQQLGFCMAKVDGSEVQSVIDKDGIYVKTLKFFFDANQRGLVDPESTTQNFDTLSTKFKNGEVLYSFWPWLGSGQYNTVEHTAEGKGFATAIIDDMQCLEYGSMPYGKVGTGIMIGSGAEDPERLVKFIDWLYSPEGVFTSSVINSTTAGPEGLAWENKDGKPVLTDFGIEAFVNKTENLEVPAEWGGGLFTEGACQLNYKSVGLVDCDPDTGICYNYQKWDDYLERTATTLSKNWSDQNGGALNTIDLLNEKGKLLVLPGSDYATPELSTDLATIKEQCKQVIVEYSWKMIFADDEAAFNSLLDEMTTTVEGLGYDQVLEVDMKNVQDEFAAFDAAKKLN
ncbi:MAG: extracellular solute-binding protein [Coprococcus sp.]